MYCTKHGISLNHFDMFTCTESQNPSLMAQFVNRHVLEQMTFRVLQTYYISD